MNELALYAGVGGGLLATRWLLGWRTVCYVENDLYRVEVLKARIRDGLLDDAPIWDDARTFDGRLWRGCVDIVTAGFPCQPFSVAGRMEAQDDERNPWPDTLRIIREVGPEWCLLENTSGLLSRRHGYFGQLLTGLAESGYDVQWRMLSAAEMGAPHRRDRVWIIAYSSKNRWPRTICGNSANSENTGWPKLSEAPSTLDTRLFVFNEFEKRMGEPPVFRMDNGMAHRVDRLAAAGDGQVPTVVAAVWRLLVVEKLGEIES